jgi:hypothetical protein
MAGFSGNSPKRSRSRKRLNLLENCQDGRRRTGRDSSKRVHDGEPNSSGGISFREYLLQRPQRGGERLCRDCSQFLRQPGLVHGANLIEQDQTLPATMSDADPKRRLATRRSDGCDQYGAQMIVHFGRGHYHTRARLPDFTPDGRIKIHEPNLSTRHQTNSESSALPNSPITSSSSPAPAILLAASAQPTRGGFAGLRNTSALSSIVISAPASLSRPSCASTGLGMTTPWELPIRRMLTCTARIVITMLFRRAWRVKLAQLFPFMRPPAQQHADVKIRLYADVLNKPQAIESVGTPPERLAAGRQPKFETCPDWGAKNGHQRIKHVML